MLQQPKHLKDPLSLCVRYVFGSFVTNCYVFVLSGHAANTVHVCQLNQSEGNWPTVYLCQFWPCKHLESLPWGFWSEMLFLSSQVLFDLLGRSSLFWSTICTNSCFLSVFQSFQSMWWEKDIDTKFAYFVLPQILRIYLKQMEHKLRHARVKHALVLL